MRYQRKRARQLHVFVDDAEQLKVRADAGAARLSISDHLRRLLGLKVRKEPDAAPQE